LEEKKVRCEVILVIKKLNLALVKAYEHTNKQKFLDLATYFIDERGTHSNPEDHYYVNEKKNY
jgi:DUF1680 family protein